MSADLLKRWVVLAPGMAGGNGNWPVDWWCVTRDGEEVAYLESKRYAALFKAAMLMADLMEANKEGAAS